MGKVIASAAVSADGFTEATADYLRPNWASIGAVVMGRRLFDLTNGWSGRPAVGDHVFVVTHEKHADWLFPDAPFTFATCTAA
jgi:dihydrofolate reductase